LLDSADFDALALFQPYTTHACCLPWQNRPNIGKGLSISLA
jgi:hypothetical protein